MSFQTFIASLGTSKKQTHVQIKERIEQLHIHLWIENTVTVREGKHYRVLELSPVSKEWKWTAQYFTARECLRLLDRKMPPSAGVWRLSTGQRLPHDQSLSNSPPKINTSTQRRSISTSGYSNDDH